MKNFSALTKSGASYEARDGVLTIVPRNGFPESIKPLLFGVLDRPVREMDVLRNLEAAEVPELGRSIYIETADGWRLSTEVVKIEVVAQ